MTKAGSTHDISITNPGGSEVGLMLAKDEQGKALWRRYTTSILPSGAPPGAIKAENFDPQVQIEYTWHGAELGVGYKRHTEGGRIAGLVNGVDTRFADTLFCGPKVKYISDSELASNVGMETWSGGLPSNWTKINGGETVTQETSIKHGGSNSAKVTSAGSGHGLRQSFTASYFRQVKVRLRCWVYVATGQGAPTVRIHLNTGNTDGTTSTKDAWTQIDINTELSTTVLADFSIDLIPATNNIAYFDDVQLTFEYLVGSPGNFTELEISGTDRLFLASGRTVFRLNSTTGGWEAWDSASASVTITDLISHNTTMYRALGASNLWEYSTDGITWSANSRSGDDRYANRWAVTFSFLGSLLLWKALLPNKLATTATPNSGSWTTYTVGSSDTAITDLVVAENLLYIIKEDGVYTLDQYTGESVLLTPEWRTLRYARQGFGGNHWLGRPYIPSGRNALWEFDPENNTRARVHPAIFGAEALEYSGKPTRVIGDGSWLYTFLQQPASTPETTHLMAGSPVGDSFRYGHLGQIDAGRVDFATITATQYANPRLYWSSRQQDTTDAASVSLVASAGAGANRDVGNTDWSNPGNVTTADDNRATWSGSSSTSTKSAGAGANRNSTDWESWQGLTNLGASDNANATAYTSQYSYSAPTYTDHLQATQFGFAIPSTATILGIKVSIEGRDAYEQMHLADVSLLKAGTRVGDNKASGKWLFPFPEEIKTFGGASDLWGTTWTPAEINATNFGVEHQAYRIHGTSPNELQIDHIQIQVTYSTVNQQSDFLDVTGFGFAVPTSATIVGIVAEIERSQSISGLVKDVTVQALKAGSATGDNRADTTTTWPTTDTIKSYGSSTDMWGTSWTPAEINASNFGLTLKVEGGGGADTARVDHVRMTVYYTPAGGSELNNVVGWIALPTTENPRFSEGYDYASSASYRSGILNRFPGWKTAFQSVTVKSSLNTNERLGSNGRQVTVKYNIFDGNGFVELGGSGNGVFNTSPSQKKYFKTSSVSSVVAEDIEIELTLATGDESYTPVIEEVTIAGTVRPTVVDVYEFTVLAGQNLQTLGGQDLTTRSTMVNALRTMTSPAWTTALRDRDGAVHQVYAFPDQGYEEVDILQYPEGVGSTPEVVKAIRIRCFEVPNSSSW